MNNIFQSYSKVAGLAALMTISGYVSAQAGGLAVREQSTQFQGTSFAGNAAGGGNSSSFWNSAAIGEAGQGLTTENGIAILSNRAEFEVLPTSHPALLAGDTADTNGIAAIPSSYVSYRLNSKTVLGLAINSPFGIATEMSDKNGAFRLHHQEAEILTINANPMVSHEIVPGVFLGAGVQIQYISVAFRTDSGSGFGMVPVGPTTGLEGDDIALGYTLGLLLKPSESTSIGIGYRSAITHTVEGDQFVNNTAINVPFKVGLSTPQMVTASVRQGLTDTLRIMGTVEYTNWDTLGIIPIESSISGGSAFDFQYHDSWFFSVGGEMDVSDKLTLRTGLAYEISPVQNPSERLVQVPDADRVWLSAGGTYKYSDTMSFDFAYTHVFVENSTLSRHPANPALAAVNLDATVEPEADIFSIGMKMKWGG